MNPEKVLFGFFIVLALTLNFGFFVGELDNPEHHHVYELFAVIVVNLIATVLKFGDRTQMGAVLLATSLVAILQLFAAALLSPLAMPAEHPTYPQMQVPAATAEDLLSWKQRPGIQWVSEMYRRHRQSTGATAAGQ